jgi:Zn finger protein HypA/HybF involved in hydrogenase expression
MNKSQAKKVSDEDFSSIVSESTNYAQICRAIGLRCQGSNYRTIKNRIKRLNLSIAHFRRHVPNQIAKELPIDKVFIKNSKYNCSKGLKTKLLKQDLLEYKCQKCSNTGEWQGQPMSLQIDHINGIRNDNRIENLRFLCPNCHSQTFTHSGKRFKKPQPKCPKCGVSYPGYGDQCNKCYQFELKNTDKYRKVSRPSRDQLLKELSKSNYSALGRKYGVSDNAIRKWLR